MRFDNDINLILTSVLRFSAIQCAAAVPRAPAESASSRKFEQANPQAACETQANELTTNGHGPPTSKQASQQPKGIMGMLISKAATKTQDTNKETKTEAREVPSVSLLTSRPFVCDRMGSKKAFMASMLACLWMGPIISSKLSTVV